MSRCPSHHPPTAPLRQLKAAAASSHSMARQPAARNNPRTRQHETVWTTCTRARACPKTALVRKTTTARLPPEGVLPREGEAVQLKEEARHEAIEAECRDVLNDLNARIHDPQPD